MKRYCGKKGYFLISLALGIFLFAATFRGAAQGAETVGSELKTALGATENIDSHIAGMSDVQVRQAYAQKLKQEATAQSASAQSPKSQLTKDEVSIRFYAAARGASVVLTRVGNIFSGSGAKSDSVRWRDTVGKLSDGRGVLYLLLILAGVGIIIAIGLGLRMLLVRSTSEFQENLLHPARFGKLYSLGRILLRILLDALGLGVYVLATFIIFVVAYEEGKPSYTIASEYIIVSYYIMAFAFMAGVMFSPKAPSLRLFPMEDRDATFLYQWIIIITVSAGVVIGAATIFHNSGAGRNLVLLTTSASGVVIISALVIMIWQSRKRVARAIWSDESEASDKEKGGVSMRAVFARNWHYAAMIYVLVAGVVWITKSLNGENVSIANLIVSIFLIPVFIGVDQWIQRLLKIASGEGRETIDLSEDAPPDPNALQEPDSKTDSKMDITNYIPLIKRFFRAFLILFLVFASLRLWGIDISVGRMLTRSAVSILVMVLLGFITWQLIKARIDQKIREEGPDQDEDAEEGGAGGSRNVTLLMLFRKFVLTVMFIMVSLIILSSIGINIGPLIAGAGVIGLAIGFGAQTLVKDIISGIFFLIDDAFRIGDYVETGGTKGTVEQLTLRSMKIRNPRGPVHTVPFGSMGTVTNFSRDYTITKLDFRVRYDTDTDKVRKIMKKINKALSKNEEVAPHLLDKVKSQGIRQLDDSAMIMRVKYKTIPGKQFVVRKLVYEMMQQMFKENGIEFAHRNVTVYMPPGASGEDNAGNANRAVDPKMVEAAGAAAALAADQKG
jgi:small-conductance mechanosensitive channel